MATNYKNTVFYQISNAKQTVPASANKTGTIETVGAAVKGTSTLFTTEMQVGSWLTSLAANEIRKVIKVESNTLAYLDHAFTVDIAAGVTPNVVKHSDLNIREVAIAIPLTTSGGVAQAFGEVDGQPLASGLPVSFGKNSDIKDNFKSFVDPIIANATGTVINVTILR